ncbi:aldose 1-epimerase family protein [Microbacteriaceae bacterium VKM Ac-2855]|nr:aldose 1-epimerase family protein [Microbacteriaceae bacterium VKM Ac-2855]
MTTNESYTFGSDALTVRVAAHGAEMTSLQDADGTEYLWQAGPEWRRHAPVLFPIIGRVPDDTIHHDGRDYELRQHGFARDRVFELAGIAADEAVFRLRSDAETLEKWPFVFSLAIGYAVDAATVHITQTVTNTGDVAFGASVGNHPAFGYPLPGATGPHAIAFSQPEPAGFKRAPENLLLPTSYPAPFTDGALPVDETLFEDGVLIFDEPKRRTVRLSAPGATSITIDTGDFDVIGVWKPVGAPFLCLEPWRSIPTPAGWNGDIVDKPEQFVLEAGESRAFGYSITIG